MNASAPRCLLLVCTRITRGVTLKTMLAKEIMMGMPTQPLMKPKDASVTADGCCFSAAALWALLASPPGCRVAVPASASAGHQKCKWSG